MTDQQIIEDLGRALRDCLSAVEEYAAVYDANKVALGAYEACSRVRKIVKRSGILLPTKGASANNG